MNRVSIARWDELADRVPGHALVANVDLVIVRWDEQVTVMYGRCHHRGAMLSDGHIEGENLFCGVHGWDYRYKTGISEYHNSEQLHRFSAWVEGGELWVDEDEIAAWEREHPQPFQRDQYQGSYADVHGTEEEPFVGVIQELAANGLKKVGGHGPSVSMGVLRSELPNFDDLQFITAQLAKLPQLEEVPCGTDLVIGPGAKKPLHLKIPIFVSDMSFGSLSMEAKTALARGANLAGTGICSGEGGMLPEEQAENQRYFYELASARFGFSMDKLQCVQAFHYKGGQAAKTGTGGHLPASKVKGRIAEVRQLPEGKSAISPSRFPDWDQLSDFRDFSEEVRSHTGGIPIGFKLSAQHIEKDIDAALEIGVDYIILAGRGGGTGSAPSIFRDHISVPSIAALPRARKHLDSCGKSDVTLIATGGLRTPADFAKAMALGADGVAVSNAAMQAIGCLGMRACHTNNCPVGIATQKEHLRERLPVDLAAERLQRFFESSVHLMAIMARACGHTHLNQFNRDDLTTWKRDVAHLTGVQYAGVASL